MQRSLVFALVLILVIPSLSTAQSGRRPTYPTNQGTSANKGTPANSAPTNGDCPAGLFPGEMEDLSSSSVAVAQPQSVSDPNAEEILKIDTTLVTFPVTVLSRSGQFIPSLSKCNFHIYEDGVRHEVAEFSAVETPFNVVLLLDTSGSTQFKIEDIHDAAIQFTHQLRPEDRVMVVSFDSRIDVKCDFTSDRNIMRRAIQSTHNGGSTRLYDAVDQVITQFLSPIQGRKAIVLFTDGVDTSSRRASDRSTVELVEESDVLVFPISYDTFDAMRGGGRGYPPGQGGIPNIGNFPFPLPRTRNPRNPRWPVMPWVAPQIQIGRGNGSAADYERARRYLDDLATHSGGTLYKGDSVMGVSSAFAKIAESLRFQYSLGYYPKNTAQDGTYRKIKVRASDPQWIVKSKAGYRAAGQAGTKAEANNERPVLKRKNLAGNIIPAGQN